MSRCLACREFPHNLKLQCKSIWFFLFSHLLMQTNANYSAAPNPALWSTGAIIKRRYLCLRICGSTWTLINMFVPLFDLCSSPHRQRKQKRITWANIRAVEFWTLTQVAFRCTSFYSHQTASFSSTSSFARFPPTDKHYLIELPKEIFRPHLVLHTSNRFLGGGDFLETATIVTVHTAQVFHRLSILGSHVICKNPDR